MLSSTPTRHSPSPGSGRRVGVQGRRGSSGEGTPALIHTVASNKDVTGGVQLPGHATNGRPKGRGAGNVTVPIGPTPKFASSSATAGGERGPRGSAGIVGRPPQTQQRPGMVQLTNAALRKSRRRSLEVPGMAHLNSYQQSLNKRYQQREHEREIQLRRAMFITALIVVILFTVAVVLVIIWHPGGEGHEPCGDQEVNCTRKPPP